MGPVENIPGTEVKMAKKEQKSSPGKDDEPTPTLDLPLRGW